MVSDKIKGLGSLGTLLSLRQMHQEEDVEVVKDLFTDKEYENGLKQMDDLLKDIEETKKKVHLMKYDLKILSHEKTFDIQNKKDLVRKQIQALSEPISENKEYKIKTEELVDPEKEKEYKEILKKIEQQSGRVLDKFNQSKDDEELKKILSSEYCKPVIVDDKKMEENIDNLVSSIDECLKFGEEIDEYINQMLKENVEK